MKYYVVAALRFAFDVPLGLSVVRHIGRIPRHRHRHPREDPREEIARVGRKDGGVSGESVSVSMSMSVSWNAGLLRHVVYTGGACNELTKSAVFSWPPADQTTCYVVDDIQCKIHLYTVN